METGASLTAACSYYHNFWRCFSTQCFAKNWGWFAVIKINNSSEEYCVDQQAFNWAKGTKSTVNGYPILDIIITYFSKGHRQHQLVSHLSNIHNLETIIIRNICSMKQCSDSFRNHCTRGHSTECNVYGIPHEVGCFTTSIWAGIQNAWSDCYYRQLPDKVIAKVTRHNTLHVCE